LKVFRSPVIFISVHHRSGEMTLLLPVLVALDCYQTCVEFDFHACPWVKQ
jgi:hypothetical protein